jgi:hypothetical protein
MMEHTPYIFRKCVATPDRLIIPDWGMNFLFYENCNVTFTYYKNKLYVGNDVAVHHIMYSHFRFMEEGFDGRIWYKYKIFTFWYNADNCDMSRERVVEMVKDMKERLLNGDYIYYEHIIPGMKKKREEPPTRIDLSEYTFIFIATIDGNPEVVKCDYETFINPGFELFDTFKIRFFVTIGRGRGVVRNWMVDSIKEKKQEKTAYELSCEYWENKIGNMDVAEWHLLIYEE